MTQYPGGYFPHPYAAHPPPPSTPRNSLGTSALLVAILGLVFCWSVVGGVVCGVVAVVLGFSGHGRAKRGEADNGVVAMAGLALGALAVVVSLAVIGIWVRVYTEVDVPGYADCISSVSDAQGADECAEALEKRIDEKFGVSGVPGP